MINKGLVLIILMLLFAKISYTQHFSKKEDSQAYFLVNKILQNDSTKNNQTGKKYFFYQRIFFPYNSDSANTIVKIPFFLFLRPASDAGLTAKKTHWGIKSIVVNGKKLSIKALHSKQSNFNLTAPINKLQIKIYNKDTGTFFYQYQLLGYDRYPIISKYPVIQYYNLPPGKYKLIIHIFDKHGKIDTSYISLQFNVITPASKHFFKVLKTLLLILVFTVIIIVILIYHQYKSTKLLRQIKIQKHELEKRNQELKEKIRTVEEQAVYIKKLHEELKQSFIELQETNRILKEKEQMLISQNSEIESSLKYAQQIQNMLLPGFHDIKQIFQAFFILYIPQEYVSGDFYWVSIIGRFKIAIVGDATGHGVPGALMSILGMSILKKLINEYHIIEPAQILNSLKLDLQSYYRKYQEVEESLPFEKEGFALSIVKIDPKEQLLTYSTAGQTIYVISTQNLFLHELRDSRRDITFAYHSPTYNQHYFRYNNGDMLYMFTDGYADQIGGRDGKKFKYHRLKDTFLSIASMPTDTQKNILEETLNDWMNYPASNQALPYFQIDDITVFGIRL